MVNRGWLLRNTIIWHEPNCLPASVRDRFAIDFEYLFLFTKSQRCFFERQFEPHHPSTKRRVSSFRARQDRYDPWRHKTSPGRDEPSPFEILVRISNRGLNPRGRNKRCVWTIPVRGFPGPHFAVYPEGLVETPICAGCPKGGIVLDPFFGTGTTGIVARKLKRHFIGIELNPDYVETARQRLGLEKREPKSD